MTGNKKWTFMVYLAGDNNLEAFGTKDLYEMKKVGSSDEVSIVAQFDRMSDQVTRRYCLTGGGELEADCVAELPKVNTGDPDALIDFVKWACGAYKADHYALVLWNHGSGWKDDNVYEAAEAGGVAYKVSRGQVRSLTSGKPGRVLFSTTLEQLVVESAERAILFDDSAADFLDNQELKRVLEEAAPTFDGQLDLLGFDACLMNMLEVGYQVQHLCQVLVGSQEVEPGDGWPYDTLLKQLADDPDMAPEALGRAIVQEYNHFYQSQYPGLAVTQSAVRLEALEPVAEAVSNLGDVLVEGLSDVQKLAGIVFAAMRHAQSFTDRDYVDLAHFCRLLADGDPGGAVGSSAQQIAELMAGDTSPVIAEAHSGSSVAYATGLSIYLPARVFSPLYSDLDFAKQHRWDEFLDAFVNPQ
jgi:hypothetical protein